MKKHGTSWKDARGNPEFKLPEPLTVKQKTVLWAFAMDATTERETDEGLRRTYLGDECVEETCRELIRMGYLGGVRSKVYGIVYALTKRGLEQL